MDLGVPQNIARRLGIDFDDRQQQFADPFGFTAGDRQGKQCRPRRGGCADGAGKLLHAQLLLEKQAGIFTVNDIGEGGSQSLCRRLIHITALVENVRGCTVGGTDAEHRRGGVIGHKTALRAVGCQRPQPHCQYNENPQIPTAQAEEGPQYRPEISFREEGVIHDGAPPFRQCRIFCHSRTRSHSHIRSRPCATHGTGAHC